jgi:hypothetical protein
VGALDGLAARHADGADDVQGGLHGLAVVRSYPDLRRKYENSGAIWLRRERRTVVSHTQKDEMSRRQSHGEGHVEGEEVEA